MNVKCLNQCLAYSRTVRAITLIIPFLKVVFLKLKIRSTSSRLGQVCVWKGRTLADSKVFL